MRAPADGIAVSAAKLEHRFPLPGGEERAQGSGQEQRNVEKERQERERDGGRNTLAHLKHAGVPG